MGTVTCEPLLGPLMTEGIRVELQIEDPAGCTVAATTGAAGNSTFNVSRSINPETPDHMTEEFAMAGPLPDTDLPDEVVPVFEYGEETMYRFTRERGRGCPCEVIEARDCPVVDLHTREHDLYLTFHAPSMERLQATVQDLRDEYPSLSVRRLLRTSADSPGGSTVLVDRGVLTDRQREVLETAHEMGYFEHPKRVNAGEVAQALDISSSTFAEHLAAAQRKLLATILDR